MTIGKHFTQLINAHEQRKQSSGFQLKPLGEKSIHYIQNSNAYINITVGAIRSSKTITTILRFLAFIGTSPHTDFAMAGVTLGALKRNVVNPLLQILDQFGVEYTFKRADWEIHIHEPRKVITLFGIEKIRSDEKIKGFTCAGTFLDEVTIMDQEGVYMLLSRNSLSGAKIFMTCNPGNPNNFVNTDYVSNEKLKSEGRVNVYDFVLDDNPTLDEEYVKHIKSLYPEDSLFYKRNILGEWVSGQGAIFDKFSDDNIYGEVVSLDYFDYIEVSSDYGTSTTTCYSLIGVKEFDDHNEFRLICERGYDAEKEGVTQTDAERVEDIFQLQEDYGLDEDNVFYVSHDAESLKAALEKDSRIRMIIKTFMPDTLECIQVMSSLFYRKHLLIHESCTETVNQIRGYEWDIKAANRGVDKPVKKDDHYIDSMRGVIMNHLFDDDAQVLGGVVDFREVFS